LAPNVGLAAGGAPGYRTRSLAGAVAQLGERLNGIQEVRGSIPLSSTRDISGFMTAARMYT
jgi:hypothetical protein